jgi:hypothetical protein
MNWKLIFKLSLFGLAMAFLTISVIPGNIEMLVWLPIFIICAYLVAKQASGRYFLYGFLISLVNSAYVTSAHIIFYSTYIVSHAEEAEMSAKMSTELKPQQLMMVMGPIIGVVMGLILGLFCWIASRMIKKQPA